MSLVFLHERFQYNNYYMYLLFSFILIAAMSIQNNHCSDYDIKLVDGPSANEGKLLICINRVWGTLCNDNINSTDAAVICRQLGYRAEGKTPSTSTEKASYLILHTCMFI